MWKQVEPLLRSRFPSLAVKLTTAAGDAERFAAEFARAHRAGQVIVVGGDGSIHEIVNGLVDAGYEGSLGIVPAGTGNDVARNLGIANRPDSLDPSRARPIDLARVSLHDSSGGQRHRWFVNSLSVGASARANRIALAIGGLIRGPIKYPIAGVLALLSGGADPYDVMVAGTRRFIGPAINLTVANGACVGGGLRISPDSVPDDESLELVIIGALSRIGALGALRSLRTGGHLAMRDVTVIAAGSAPIEIRGPGVLRLETDGENLVSHQCVIVNLEPGRLRVAR